MNPRKWIWTLASAPLLGLTGLQAAEPKPAQNTKALFRMLEASSAEQARSRCLDWLKQSGKADQATLERFNKLWSEDRGVLERVAGAFALGDKQAADLLRQAADPNEPAPTGVPDLFRDNTRSEFFRANLGVAYAKALAQRRVHEEALAVLQTIPPDQVVEPAAYYFYRALAAHALLLENETERSIESLRTDVVGSPARYTRVADLILIDMSEWKENVPARNRAEFLRRRLGPVTRRMANVERRLDLSRAGPNTQKQQDEVIARLDKLIGELEGPPPEPPEYPPPDVPSKQISKGPAGDEYLPQEKYYERGSVDNKALWNLRKMWGKLPPKERERAMAQFVRDMPPRWADVVERYFRDLARVDP